MSTEHITLDEYREIKNTYGLLPRADDLEMVMQCNDQHGMICRGEPWTATQWAMHFVRVEACERQGDMNEARANMEW